VSDGMRTPHVEGFQNLSQRYSFHPEIRLYIKKQQTLLRPTVMGVAENRLVLLD